MTYDPNAPLIRAKSNYAKDKYNESERKAMGLRAHMPFLRNFTVQHCAEQYYCLIKQIFSQR